jgi:hypothetical protein
VCRPQSTKETKIMKKLISVVTSAALTAVLALAPVATAQPCKSFAVPVSITNCTLPGGVGFASTFVSLRDVNKTKWQVGSNLFVGRTSSIGLFDKNSQPINQCFGGDNSPDGNWGPTTSCTTTAGQPKTGTLYISL